MTRVGTVLSLPDPVLAELACQALDFAWIDLEHGALSTGDAQVLALAARAAGTRAYVRLPTCAPDTLPAILDAGADGVVAPRVESAAGAAALVRRLRYPPAGSRGFGPRRAGDWVVAAAGSPPGDLLKLWRCPPGSHAHLEFAFSCMGHEIPAGLGIRMAGPEAGEVVVVIGDGTYLMAPSELVTAVQEGLRIVVVVLVNGGFQSIHALQRSTLATSFGNEFAVDVDYAANAASLGCAAWTVTTEAELATALEAARGQPRPAVIACHVDPRSALPDSGAWWDLGVPAVATDPEAAARAAGHARGAERQRFHG